jgi:RimJ/RimL family protein N-acetyltransferase
MSDMFKWVNERIILQAFEPEQVSLLCSHLNHPELVGRRYLPWEFPDDLPLSCQQAEAIYKKWIEKQNGFNLAIILPEGRELIGHINCDWGWDTHCPQVSVVVYPEYQRCGYASEGLRIILDYLFLNTPAYNISGWIEDWNYPALEFALNCGFTQSGRSRRERLRNGVYSDSILFDMLRDEWLERKESDSHGA